MLKLVYEHFANSKKMTQCHRHVVMNVKEASKNTYFSISSILNNHSELYCKETFLKSMHIFANCRHALFMTMFMQSNA